MKKKIINVIVMLLISACMLMAGVKAGTTIAASSVAYGDITVESQLDELIEKANYGNATASQILSGKTALVAGTKITGSMTNRGAVTNTITPSTSVQTYTVPSGYHNGSGKVTVKKSVHSWIKATSLSYPGITGYENGEDSFTMPAAGTVYWDGIVLNYGGGTATFYIYKNSDLVASYSIDTSSIMRGGNFGAGKSFSAASGDVIRVQCVSTSGKNFAGITARIIYYSS